MENKDFDQFIKKSLENLDGAAYVPMDWSLMDDKLGMDGLDDLMKESLGDLEGQEYAPMNWSLMADKLDAEIGADTHAELDTALSNQMEDIYLDAVAYDHLENLKPPYNKEHWKIMEARLDEEYAYRRKVMITKIMEAAIVLLLVWTAINFFPNKKNTVTPQPSPVANSQENVNNFDKKYFPNNLISKNTTTPNSSEEAKTEKNIENNQKLLASGSQDLEPLSPIVIPPVKNILEEEILNSEKQEVIAAAAQNENKPNSPSIYSFDKMEKVSDLLTQKQDVISLPSLSSCVLIDKNGERDLTVFSSFLKKQKVRTHDFFFSMFSSADYNYVQSKFRDSDVGDAIYKRGQEGYGGGFSLGFQLNRLLVETGAMYNFIRYQQREEAKIKGNFVEGYFKEKWEGAELNMLQVPLNIQYSFLLKSKWRMYSLTGVSLNMALQNNFDFQLDIDNNSIARRSFAPIKKSKIVTEANEFQGFFEGGSFRKNSYLTANLGFGLERKFTYRWSLYLQPVYQHHFLFEGIGPNKDKINTGSLRLGAKVKIW